MKRFPLTTAVAFPLVGIAIAVLATGVAHAQSTETTTDSSPQLRIGTFDSRLVALAYYRSPQGMKVVDALKTDVEIAQSAGDRERIRTLEITALALQNLMHQQVFGRLSIPNVIATLESQLPGIAKEAGVSLLVSKWEIALSGPQVATVDVTSRLLELFDIDEPTREMLDDFRQKNPPPVGVDEPFDPGQ